MVRVGDPPASFKWARTIREATNRGQGEWGYVLVSGGFARAARAPDSDSRWRAKELVL
jgi:hypothetical protein